MIFSMVSKVTLWSMTRATESGKGSLVKSEICWRKAVLIDAHIAPGDAGHQAALRILDRKGDLDEVDGRTGESEHLGALTGRRKLGRRAVIGVGRGLRGELRLRGVLAVGRRGVTVGVHRGSHAGRNIPQRGERLRLRGVRNRLLLRYCLLGQQHACQRTRQNDLLHCNILPGYQLPDYQSGVPSSSGSPYALSTQQRGGMLRPCRTCVSQATRKQRILGRGGGFPGRRCFAQRNTIFADAVHEFVV